VLSAQASGRARGKRGQKSVSSHDTRHGTPYSVTPAKRRMGSGVRAGARCSEDVDSHCPGWRHCTSSDPRADVGSLRKLGQVAEANLAGVRAKVELSPT